MAELLQQLVTRQAEWRPEAVALVMNGARINYAALEDASNRLARQLRAVAPRPDFDSNPTTLRLALSKALPSYMLPSRWMSFERLPQNGNGKIDRRALRERFQQI